MKASGNGNPEQCVHNLLSIVRGEVPYERIKGIDARILDKPAIQAENEMKEDTEWMLQTYEPRVTVNKIRLEKQGDFMGEFHISADIKGREDDRF